MPPQLYRIWPVVLDGGQDAVGSGVVVDGLDAPLGLLALVLDQGEGTCQVGGEVLGVGEEVGQSGLDVGIALGLPAERPEVIHGCVG